ncbi:DUF6916 family protein [Pseudaestuariivita atlantica]|uniref:DUF6916 domain-containing protein n=1 Tax=Pseudaestuariivita atlantica TaxID=1317121 RepID=A0A0L1JMH0_9RHOB|nr:hypothetical protein [Pseudaestuariivita atlantica]KNG92940.1 hypothetical protein ATO11_13465 [Pseudaestuariivita atlantica]
MSYFAKVTRRTLLAGQAAVAMIAALPGTVRAGLGGEAATAPQTAPVLSAPRWHNVTAVEMEPLVGERFRLHSKVHGDLVLKLTAVDPVNSGPARPAHLPRRAGLTATFEGPDIAPIVDDGYGTYRVSHRRLGTADLHLIATPRRHGGHTLELVLN